MTYNDMISWVKGKVGDFDSYDDIEKFNSDVEGAPAKYGKDGRVQSAQSLVGRWIDGDLDNELKSGLSYSDAEGKIMANRLDILRGMSQEDAQEELRKIQLKPYSSDTLNIAESIVGEKIDESTEEQGKEIKDIINTINRATTVVDIDEAIAQSPSTGSLRRQGLNDLASDLSLAIAEAAERKFDLENNIGGE